MLSYLYYALMILNFLLILFKSKPKIILYIDFLFALILFYGNTANNDFQYYLNMYNNGLFRTSYEIGFNAIMDICKAIGITYNHFLAILWCLFGTLIVFVYSKFSDNYSLLFFVYFSYFIFIDIVQIKSYCAGTLLLISLYYKFYGKKKYSIIFFIGSVLVHFQMLFFIPIIFMNLNKSLNKKTVKYCGIGILLICILMFVLGMKTSIISVIGMKLLSIIGGEDKISYFGTQSRFGFLLYFALHIFSVLTTLYIKNRFDKYGFSNENYIFLENCLVVQMYCFFCFPLIMMNMNFFRLYKAVFLFSVCSWGMGIHILNREKYRYFDCCILILISAFIYRFPLVQGNDQISIILNNNNILR